MLPLCLGAALASLSACATLRSYRPAQLPAMALTYFSECRGQDGAVTFQFLESAGSSDKVDAEWVARQNGDWTLASYSPLGQTLFQASFSQSPLALQYVGRQNIWFSSLSVQKDGYLRWKGEKLGLKALEVACFLETKLPRAWLKSVVDQSAADRITRLDMAEEDRRMTIFLYPYGEGQDILWESTLEWHLYWGLRHQSLKVRKLRSGTLELSSDDFPQMTWRIHVREE